MAKEGLMIKSPTQEKLEAQRNQDIRDIVLSALRKFRGRRNMLMLVSVELEVSDATVYRWCETLGIDINEYRRVAPDAEKAAAEARERVLAEGGE